MAKRDEESRRFEPPPAYSDQNAVHHQHSVSIGEGVILQPGYPTAPPLVNSQGVPTDEYLNRLRTMAAVTIQPGAPPPQAHRWMAKPQFPPSHDIPPGLEYLRPLSRVHIRQVIDLLEMATAVQLPNRYFVENDNGEQIYVTTETMNLMRAQMMMNRRAYKFDLYDQYDKLAFRVERPEASFCCWCGCCDSCRTRSLVESPVGTLAGSIYTKQSCCSLSFGVMDEHGRTIFNMDGPCCCGGDVGKEVTFNFDQAQGKSSRGEVTIVRKDQRGIPSGNNRNDIVAEMFEIKFPVDLDVRSKATLIGACILIDFLQFDSQTRIATQRHTQS